MSDIPSQEFDAVQRPSLSRRVAWLAVIIMTTLFLLAVVAVVWGFVRQYRQLAASQAVAAVAAPAHPVALGPGRSPNRRRS